MNIRWIVLTLTLTTWLPTLVTAQSADAQDGAPAFGSVDEEWPCIQVLIPELSAGILWPRPLGDDVTGSWQDTPAVAPLARALGAAERYDEALRTRVSETVATWPEDSRAADLDRLAAGIVEIADDRRRGHIRGIKRYTRQQIAMALQIEQALNLLDTYDYGSPDAAADNSADGTPSAQAEATLTDADLDDPAQRQAFEQTLAWHKRVYDQRERSIVSLCERPVELEQTLSDILRDVATYLP